MNHADRAEYPSDGVQDAGTLRAVDPVASMTRVWQSELSVLGGRSPLLHFDDSARSRIELGTTHPGGLAQFITGTSTLLSNLIREDVSLRSARRAAEVIVGKGIELRTVRGIDSVALAIGLASWSYDGVDYCAPVLLRPLGIRRYGNDFELKLDGVPAVNPELAAVLRTQFGIALDSDFLVSLSLTGGVFKPQPVIDKLRSLTAGLPTFSVEPRLVVSSFASVGTAMAADVAAEPTLSVRALAGDRQAESIVAGAHRDANPVAQDHRAAATDSLLLDADEHQERIIAQISAGNSLVVNALPGSGATQTVVNAAGTLVAQNKRVLIVSPRRSSLHSIEQRLDSIGLPGLAVSPRSLRTGVIRAINRNEKAEKPAVDEVDEALVRLRKVLVDYRTALTESNEGTVGVSAQDALRELSRLALLRKAPSTTARLDVNSVIALSTHRLKVAKDLAKAAKLGQFRYGPEDSEWYGAHFPTSADADDAHRLAKDLSAVGIPLLLAEAEQLVGQTRLRPFESITELGQYLRLLLEIRETLDTFLPSVFDRSLAELIVATSPRRESTMSMANRRRLKGLAREYVRPGAAVPDLHESLKRIQQQRLLWQRYVTIGSAPSIPTGLAATQEAYQRVYRDLAELDKPLGRGQDTVLPLADLPVEQLLHTMAGLSADSEVLDNLQERTALLEDLRQLGLDPLLADLSKRHVPAELVGNELELAWWQSVLEMLLAEKPALLGANTQVLDRLESDFRLVDEAHAQANPKALAWQLAESWSVGLTDYPEEADALRQLLRGGAVRSATLHRVAPHLSRPLAPIWLASPYEVPSISDEMVFDAVFLLDAGTMTLAESIPAVRRAKQIVAVGDPVIQTTGSFITAVTSAEAAASSDVEADVEAADRATESAYDRLVELFPVEELTRSYRSGGEDLFDLVNKHFYSTRIQQLPWAGSYLGHGSLRLHTITQGTAMPDAVSGTVESVDAEVDRVVALVLEHAQSRADQSLMVVTASAKHALRVDQAVVAAFAKRTDLNDFILRERAEPFTVMTLEQAVAHSRDRVIFSVGFGKTPHGRVLSNLGSLARPDGDTLLAVAMTRARRSMDVVSCFTADDLDGEGQETGVGVLGQLLSDMVQPAREPKQLEDGDPLLLDLAERLYSMGLEVSIDHDGQIALVAGADGVAIAVDTDVTPQDGSMREALRLRPALLRRLGWHYLRVHSFELFSDPDRVAQKIADAMGVRR